MQFSHHLDCVSDIRAAASIAYRYSKVHISPHTHVQAYHKHDRHILHFQWRQLHIASIIVQRSLPLRIAHANSCRKLPAALRNRVVLKPHESEGQGGGVAPAAAAGVATATASFRTAAAPLVAR